VPSTESVAAAHFVGKQRGSASEESPRGFGHEVAEPDPRASGHEENEALPDLISLGATACATASRLSWVCVHRRIVASVFDSVEPPLDRLASNTSL
jgi:hypothetical protein